MDLETENRIAAILLKEADELRRQAQKEGALAYLREPTVRSRPNSRFLTATVRGVQQANRIVEVNEMWRIRDKQLELENKLRGSRNKTSVNRSYEDAPDSHRNRIRKCSAVHSIESTYNSSKKRTVEDLISIDDEGLRDDEVEKFLHSRTKRGRGTVGSRMDDTGPYPHSCPDSDKNSPSEYIDEKLRRDRVKLGPEKPSSLKTSDSSDEEPLEKDYKKKVKKSSSNRHSKHHKSKEKSRDKKKKRRDKKNNRDK